MQILPQSTAASQEIESAMTKSKTWVETTSGPFGSLHSTAVVLLFRKPANIPTEKIYNPKEFDTFKKTKLSGLDVRPNLAN